MLRFVCKPDGHGSFEQEILNDATGENITRFLSVAYGATITMGQIPEAKLELITVACDVTAPKAGWLTMHPISREYVPLAAIEFLDGTRVEFAADGTPSVHVTPEIIDPENLIYRVDARTVQSVFDGDVRLEPECYTIDAERGELKLKRVPVFEIKILVGAARG